MSQFVSLSGIVLAQESSGTNILGFLFPLVILGGLFYVLLILPQRRRAKAAKELRESVAVGDEIRTVGGIYGTIRSEDEESFVIDVGGGNTMRIAKRAVAERVEDDTE